jgi:hypothetical protein
VSTLLEVPPPTEWLFGPDRAGLEQKGRPGLLDA